MASMNTSCHILLATLFVGHAAGAQQGELVARSIGPAEVRSTKGLLESVAQLRVLSSGMLVVHDRIGRRVLLLDRAFGVVKVIADTSRATGGLYEPLGTALLPAAPDSSLIVSAAIRQAYVVDPHGTVVRTIPLSWPIDVGRLVASDAGTATLDHRGRLLYRTATAPRTARQRSAINVTARSVDSAAVVRLDYTMRRLDTLGILRAYSPETVTVSRTVDDGPSRRTVRFWYTPIEHPAPTVDDWTVLPDGTVAIVRGSDYHVKLVSADGRVTRGPKVPYRWRRLTTATKVALLDSATKERMRNRGGAGVTRRMVTAVVHPGRAASGSAAGGAPVVFRDTVLTEDASAAPDPRFVSVDELPDIYPAFGIGAARADADRLLWVRIHAETPSDAGAVYDIIARNGRLIERVRIPRDAAIAGFGPNHLVYLLRRESGALVLERIRRRPSSVNCRRRHRAGNDVLSPKL